MFKERENFDHKMQIVEEKLKKEKRKNEKLTEKLKVSQKVFHVNIYSCLNVDERKRINNSKSKTKKRKTTICHFVNSGNI